MAIPNPQQPLQLCLQNHEQQRQERIMCKLRDAVLARAVAAGPTNAAVERLIQQLIPSFYTPTHPPYASMIQRAIEELNEEGGAVSEIDISEFIKREYEDLPWAHEGMLRLHLKKQCEIGVLVLDGGRYNFNLVKDGGDGGSADVETESRRKRRPGKGRRGRGRWRGREERELNNEEVEIEGGEQSERPNSGEEPQSQLEQEQKKSQQPAGKEKRRPGRPKANKVMELVPYAPEEQPLRRRGRSKTKNDMDIGMIAEVPCDVEPLNEEQPQRCRGKSKAIHGMEASTTSEAPCVLENSHAEQPLKRRGPGRPSKPKPGAFKTKARQRKASKP